MYQCPGSLQKDHSEQFTSDGQYSQQLSEASTCKTAHARHIITRLDYLLANCEETQARPHLRLVNMNLSAFVHCSSELNWILTTAPHSLTQCKLTQDQFNWGGGKRANWMSVALKKTKPSLALIENKVSYFMITPSTIHTITSICHMNNSDT